MTPSILLASWRASTDAVALAAVPLKVVTPSSTLTSISCRLATAEKIFLQSLLNGFVARIFLGFDDHVIGNGGILARGLGGERGMEENKQKKELQRSAPVVHAGVFASGLDGRKL